MAGHGNQKTWLLKPTGDASNFEYERFEILDGNNVIVDLAVADINGDGDQEVFIGNFQYGYVEVLEAISMANI